MLPHKTFDVEVKQLDEAGSFSLYAAIFGNVDRQGDVIEPNSFQNLDEFVKDGWIALNHDQAGLPIAVIDAATQDATGLLVTGRFHSTPLAQEVRTVVRERMAAGKGVKCSLGYVTDDESFERDELGRSIRHIKALSIYEASFVNLPSNPMAEVQSIKSFQPESTNPESEAEVSEATLVDTLRKALFPGLKTKGSYKADGEDVEKLRGMAKSLVAHADTLDSHSKAFKGLATACKAMGEDMDRCVKNFTSGQQQSVDARNDGNVAEEDEEKDDQAPEDEEDEEAEDEADEEELDEEEVAKGKARKAYAIELRRRALMGRSRHVCP
jgi:HK97 family phage prohead protease